MTSDPMTPEDTGGRGWRDGSWVALVTPLDGRGGLDLEALAGLLRLHAEAGTAGAVLAGSTGEGMMLEMEEYGKLLGAAVRWRKDSGADLGLAAGINGVATRDCVRAAQTAQGSGVDACMMAPPPYVRPTDEGVFQHYSAVCGASGLPTLAYNIPQRTGCDIGLELLGRLADEIPNLAGIKDAAPRAGELAGWRGGRGSFRVYAGQDELTAGYMAQSACGVVSVAANLQPRAWSDYISLALRGPGEASAAWSQLLPLCEALKSLPNPAAVKHGLALQGRCRPDLRLPLTPLHAEQAERLEGAMRQAGAL